MSAKTVGMWGCRASAVMFCASALFAIWFNVHTGALLLASAAVLFVCFGIIQDCE